VSVKSGNLPEGEPHSALKLLDSSTRVSCLNLGYRIFPVEQGEKAVGFFRRCRGAHSGSDGWIGYVPPRAWQGESACADDAIQAVSELLDFALGEQLRKFVHQRA